MGRTFTFGSVTVTLGDSLEKLAQRSRALRTVVNLAVTSELEALARDARSQWPVDTGRSRRGLKVTRTERGAKIENDVVYSPFVHRAGEREVSWRVLVLRPLRARMPRIRRVVGQRITAHLGRR